MSGIMVISFVLAIVALSGCGEVDDKTPDVVEYEDTTSTEDDIKDTVVDSEEVKNDISEQNAEDSGFDLAELECLMIRDYYSEIITEYGISGYFPIEAEEIDAEYDSGYDESYYEEYDSGYNYSGPGEGEYALIDIDGDEREELLLHVSGGTVAGEGLVIYGYNPDTRELIIELSNYPYIIGAYDNGMLEIGLSHNQGLAGDVLWPYFLYQYDEETDTYKEVAQVDAWDGNTFPSGWQGDFPDNIDTDGDKILYSIYKYGSGEDPEWVENSQYEEWHNSYINGANQKEIEWLNLDEGDIYSSIDELNKYIFDSYADTHEIPESDIGYMYVNDTIDAGMGDATEKVFNYLKDSYGLEVQIQSEGMMQADALQEGERVLYTDYDTMYALNYENKQVEDLTIFGIYPGMDVDEAMDIIKDMNFTQKYNEYAKEEIDGVYVTGISSGHYEIKIDDENGKVSKVSIVKMYSF